MVKMVPMLVEGFLLAFLFTGMLPGYFHNLPFGLPLLIGGLIVTTFWQILIGLLAGNYHGQFQLRPFRDGGDWEIFFISLS